jgi:hypothetical protein
VFSIRPDIRTNTVRDTVLIKIASVPIRTALGREYWSVSDLSGLVFESGTGQSLFPRPAMVPPSEGDYRGGRVSAYFVGYDGQLNGRAAALIPSGKSSKLRPQIRPELGPEFAKVTVRA